MAGGGGRRRTRRRPGDAVWEERVAELWLL